MLNQSFTFDNTSKVITIISNNSDGNYAIMMPRFVNASSETRTIFICIEFMAPISNSNVQNFFYGFVRSSDGATVQNSASQHFMWNTDGINSNHSVNQFGNRKSFINARNGNVWESYPEFWPSYDYGYTTNWKMTLSINFSNKNVSIRGFNESNTEFFIITRNLSSMFSTDYVNGFRFYPYVALFNNNGTQFKFNETFTIAGETNIMTL